MVRVKVRVFTFPSDPYIQNSYIVATEQGGLLPTVGALKLEDNEANTATFTQLRPRIELKDDEGMIRRNMMFQEFLEIAATAPNPHLWPSSSSHTYWFGYFENEDQEVPTVVQPHEEERPISEFLNMKTSKQSGDLIIIPQSQIGPVCEKCCQGCVKCPKPQSEVNSIV